MEKYLGVKLIEAELAKGYNNKLYLEQGIPVGDSLQEGYKVIYEDDIYLEEKEKKKQNIFKRIINWFKNDK